MLADIRRYQKYCPLCQYDKTLRKKHAVAGHIVALRPVSVWVVDLVKMPKAEDDSEWVLVCVDAFSRYVEVAALKVKSSSTVTSALVSCILAGSGGRADCIISDQGSEFHGFLMELLKILEIKQEFTASHRVAAHGTVERVNRTLADTTAHLEATEEKWHLKLPWAKLAYNAGIHKALSMGANGLSPAMVHLGRQLQVPAAGGRFEASKDGTGEGSGPVGYVEDMVQSIGKMNSWVQESQMRYNQKMEEARK